MQILYEYLKKYWKTCLLVLAFATVSQVFTLIDPIIFQRIIDEFASKPEAYTSSEFVRGVVGLILLAIGIVFVARIAKNFQDYYLSVVTQRSGADMYQDGIKHSLLLPYESFEDQRSGETLGMLQKARTDSEKYLGLLINIVFVALIGFIFVSIYAATLHYSIALMYAMTIPVIGGLSYVLTRRIKKMQKKIVAETTALAGSTTESLRNIELVKSLGLADQEIGRLNKTTDKILKLELKKLRYIRSISFVQGTLVNLVRNTILAFLLYLVFKQTITFGQFFSLYIYSFFIFGPLQQIGEVVTAHREAEASLAKFKDVVSMEPEPTPKDPKSVGEVEKVSFQEVSFSYKNANGVALKNISFDVKQGETVAFVGPSGSGKTSLIKLLVRLYQPSQGQVIYNNVEGSEADLKDLRSQIGFVTQDTQLFAGTIRENLLFANPNATEKEMLDALEKSACAPLLARVDKGLDSTIGEGGFKISGGEKQRLSIARALLRNPSILVFDEATSALDSITEAEITKTVRDLSDIKTHITFLVAHRLSTVMHADRIYVLEKGVMVEQGSHEELLSGNGLYQAMWRQQVGA